MKKSTILLVLALFCASFVFSQGFGLPGDIPGGGSNKARDRADDAMDKLEGLIPMRFFNALDRKPIQGAAIEVPNTGNFVTDANGKIILPKMPDGNYMLIFSKEGFITTQIDFRVLLGGVDLNWYSISPGLINKDFRIVLDWGERPADLDIHFVKTGGSGAYHISYVNMRTAEDGNAVLDRDDMTGYGPETVTIGKIEANAVYTCYIHDYTNRSNIESTQMAQRGAVVRVYSQNKLIHTFRIPANGKGTKWDVFTIKQGVLTPVNAVVAK